MQLLFWKKKRNKKGEKKPANKTTKQQQQQTKQQQQLSYIRLHVLYVLWLYVCLFAILYTSKGDGKQPATYKTLLDGDVRHSPSLWKAVIM